MKMCRAMLLVFSFALAGNCHAQTAAPPMRHLLVLAEEKGYRHEAVSHAAATIERLGRETGLWTTTIRTDTEALTKQKLEYNAKNLNDFDAVLFYTGGDLEMNTEQKAALLSFVHDDGKGFVGVHSATITFTSWPEYGEMIGGYFDEHPWGTFDAPILVEDPNFPGMQQFPKSVVLKDEIYQIKDFSRGRVRVLMRLDASKLDLNNPRVHRKDLDFAVTWAKMYGKGRVFYSTLGHVEQNWDDPRIQKMYVEAIKWAMGLVNADVTPRPAPAESAALPDEVASKSTLLGKWPIADVPFGASARVEDCMLCEDLVLIKRPVVIGRPRPISIQLGTERPAGHSSLKTLNFFKCFWQLYSQPVGVFLSALRVC